MKRSLWIILLSLMMPGAKAQQGNYNPLQYYTPPLSGATKSVQARPILQPANAVQAGQPKINHREEFISIIMNPEDAEVREEFFQKYSEKLSVGPDDRFVFLQQESDKIGYTHTRYNHYYKGLQVIGSQLVLHEKNGLLKSANGKFISELDLSVAPTLTAEDAIRLSIEADGAKEYVWESRGYSRFLTDTAMMRIGNYPQPYLVIMHDAGGSSRENYHSCYAVNLNATEPFGGYTYYIDIINGAVVNRISLYQNISDVPGTANTLYYGTQNITMDSYGGGYRLRESVRPIQTLDLNNHDYSTGNLSDFTSSGINWTTQEILLDSLIVTSLNIAWQNNGLENPANGEAPDLFLEIYNSANNFLAHIFSEPDSPLPDTIPVAYLIRDNSIRVEIWDFDPTPLDDSLGAFTLNRQTGNFPVSANGTDGTFYVGSRDNPAHDAHWGIEKSYDFYNNVLGRNSYNDSGAIIKSCVHFNLRANNAYWSSNNKVILIGDGDGGISSPWSCIDVVGHELTHAVIGSTANLTYQGESGALNESFADIFGTSIEFNSGTTANWTVGEKNTLVSPYYLRSMSDPNSGKHPQPDTHRGTHWYPPAQSWDNGGVHINSGVQNFWFYLLCNGGSGTNDKGNFYNVSAIGMAAAEQIAYRNLAYYLTPGSDYHDAYTLSLLAADDLYGPNSAEVAAVRSAWWAVGLGNDPDLYCHGNTWFAWPYYSFTDGSIRADYSNNSECTWLLAPTGADSLTLVFTSFDIENNYDSVIVYDGPNENYPIVTIWWGNTIPPPITSSGGALFVRFVTDNTQTFPGWSAYYVGYGLPACLGITTFLNPSGSIEDGSTTDNYANNLLCGWLIAPPCATSVTLNFTSFSTELSYDIVYVYDGNELTSPLLWAGSGAALPASITSTQGEMLVVFLSDYSIRYPGWSANYTSNGTPICSGVDIRTTDSEVISDGSGSGNYCNNLSCGWLIQPMDVDFISLVFLSFDLEPADENQNYGDAIEIYDGVDETAPLLGRYAGNALPQPITSTGPAMFIKFYSNYSVNASGFSAVYFSHTTSYCQPLTTLSASSGNLDDGSGTHDYGNSSDCSWLIQPPAATSIALAFNAFNTETSYDVVQIYDGANTSAPLLNSFSGTSLPGIVNSTGGAMYIRFYSDASFRHAGWEASYTSSTLGLASTGISAMKLYPNPASVYLNLACFDALSITSLELLDLSGREVRIYHHERCDGKILQLPLDGIADGMYQLRLSGKDGNYSLPVMIQGR